MEDNQKVQEIEPEQEEKPKPETSSTDKIQILQEGRFSITCIIMLSSILFMHSGRVIPEYSCETISETREYIGEE